jgi:hypothetical protein
MARGGVLKNGIRYFEGGGLGLGQLEAGLNAANSVVGYPYVYGDAGVTGFDCSGLMQYIYEAIAYGSPTPGPRYIGTYAWAAGGNGDMVPGPLEGGFNVYTDLTGHVGDGTHSGGDVMGSSYESIGGSGVTGGNSAAGNDGIWSIGGDQYTQSLPSPGTGMPSGDGSDPAGTIGQEVADWWTCQTEPYTGTASPSYPVNPWESQLPGMTQDYLNQVGQGTLGTAGYGGQPTGSSLQDWIVAALNGLGMDASPEAISKLESLAGQESSGDPNAMNPSGATGLMQLMPETWASYNNGGEITDPVANLMASIRYQMATYGGLVDFSPYAKGGFAMGPTMALAGESGAEFFANIEDRQASAMARRSLGTEGIGEGMAMLAERLNVIDATLHEQMKVMPTRAGEAMAGGVATRLTKDPHMHRALTGANERIARNLNYRGVKG